METTLLRILDANLNRCREGLRTVEEYTRFALDSTPLTDRIKAIRHGLREGQESLPVGAGALLDARDTAGDVGTLLETGGELSREGLEGVALAALKRVQESLRQLEEFSKAGGAPEASRRFKDLRYLTYTLEKDLAPYLGLGAWRRQVLKECELYLVSGQAHARGRSITEVTAQALAGGAKIIQLREKDWTALELIEAGRKMQALCREAGALFIVNDRVDIAKAIDADGVHLGQDDLPVAHARAILGSDKVIGVSTHSEDQARQAQADGADYIGVGPVYATQSKPDVCEPVGLELVRAVSSFIEIPFVAIGGIKAHNVDDVLAAGARRVAVITEVVGAEDITAAARTLVERVRRRRTRGGEA